MPSGRKPGPGYKGPKRSRNLTDEERKESMLKRDNTRAKQKAFLRAFCKTLKIADAAKKAKIDKRTFFNWRNKDQWFTRQYEMCVRAMVDHIENTGMTLARKGAKKKSFNKDVGFYFNTEYPTDLIRFFLRSHKPETYGNKLGVTVDLNTAVQIVLPHNGRDNKKIAKEPCGAKPATKPRATEAK